MSQKWIAHLITKKRDCFGCHRPIHGVAVCTVLLWLICVTTVRKKASSLLERSHSWSHLIPVWSLGKMSWSSNKNPLMWRSLCKSFGLSVFPLRSCWTLNYVFFNNFQYCDLWSLGRITVQAFWWTWIGDLCVIATLPIVCWLNITLCKSPLTTGLAMMACQPRGHVTLWS